MMRGVQQEASEHREIRALFGMGSYFRGRRFQDVDLVAVVDCSEDELVTSAERIRSDFRDLSVDLGCIIDLMIFTSTEFASGPLRDMATLVELYQRARAGGAL